MSAIVSGTRGLHTSRLRTIVLATASVMALAAFGMPTPVLAQQDQPAAGGQTQATDPPTRVGRVSYVQGTVSYHTADQTQWDQAAVNVPVTTGDAFYTDQNARATIQVGRAYLRLDSQTEVDVDTLDDTNAIMYVPQGSVNLTMRAMNDGEVYEILTPGGTIQINTPGRYRVDVTADGTPPKLTVLQGSADIFGDNTRVNVTGGQSQAVVVDQAPPPVQPAVETPIDTWSQQQDTGMATIPDYINPDVPGVDTTVNTGQWSEDPNYGRVWYPPDPNWVPFQQGSWEYREGYDWTWVDDQPWAFGPSHYGRTVIIDGRWAWVPGPGLVIEPGPPGVVVEEPVLIAPVFAPAVVTFIDVPPLVVGVGVGPVLGWIPLGPGEVYVPPFVASPIFVNQVNIFGGCGCWGGGGYRNTNITNVNITNITNVNITNINNVNNVTINNYRNRQWASAAPQSTLVSSGHIGQNRVNIPPNQIGNTRVVRHPPVTPTAQTRGAPQHAWTRGGGNAPTTANAGQRRPPAPGPTIHPTTASAPSTAAGTRPGTRPAPPQRSVPGSTHQPNRTAAAGAGPKIVAPPNRSPAPGTRPGTQPGTQPASAGPGTRPGTRAPTAAPGTRPGTPVTTAPGTRPGATPPQRPGTTPSTAPGTTPSTAPGTRPGTTPPQRPGTTPSTAPASRPGAPVQPQTRPQQQTRPQPTTQPGTTPPRPQPQSRPQTQPKTQPQPQTRQPTATPPRPQPQTQTRPQQQPRPQPQPQTQKAPQQPTSRQPTAAPPRPQPQPQTQTRPQQQQRPQPQPQTQKAPQQPTSRQPTAAPPRPQPQPQPQARPQQQQQPRPQPQPQTQKAPQQPTSRQPAAASPRPQPQPQQQPRPQAQPQQKTQPQQPPPCNAPHHIVNGKCV